MNEEEYTPPKSELNTDEDDVWYFDNSASNHMTSNYSYFSELNENITGLVRFGDGPCVNIKGKGSISFQCKNGEQKLLKDVYYIPALRSNVISLGQATISGYDISIRGDFLTMRDNWGSLLIKVPRSANRLYKAQLKIGKEDTNEVGRESDEEVNPHSSSVTVHETNPEDGKGWKIHHLEVKTDFLNGDRKKLDTTLKEMGFLKCVHDKLGSQNDFKRRTTSQFEMSDLGGLTYYLGIEVSQGKDFVEIKQERYARKILKEAGMEDCNATLCPMEPRLKLSKAEDEPEVEATQYRTMSTTGHVFYLGTSPITWCSQKQTTMVLSSAEFMAATVAACQAIWLREVLVEVTENEQVIVEHVSGENQRADPLTKALARIRFKEIRPLLGVQELPSSTRKFRG
ncbi:uncharacterized mitochondrial protein-like protein [Tanacetum coccineum]